MKRFLVAFALLVLLCAASVRSNQHVLANVGYDAVPSCWSPVSAANPLPITGVGPSPARPATCHVRRGHVVNQSANGFLQLRIQRHDMDQIQVDGSKNLKINCITGMPRPGRFLTPLPQSPHRRPIPAQLPRIQRARRGSAAGRRFRQS